MGQTAINLSPAFPPHVFVWLDINLYCFLEPLDMACKVAVSPTDRRAREPPSDNLQYTNNKTTAILGTGAPLILKLTYMYPSPQIQQQLTGPNHTHSAFIQTNTYLPACLTASPVNQNRPPGQT